MAKKKKDWKDDRPYSPERQLVAKSGWCLTGEDDSCPFQFEFGRCGCECHKEMV